MLVLMHCPLTDLKDGEKAIRKPMGMLQARQPQNRPAKEPEQRQD